METGAKQFQAVRGSVITMVANNTSARLQPTARSLVQGSLVWNHLYAITKGHDVNTSGLYICRQLRARRALFLFEDVPLIGEPEGRYRCTMSLAITPFWFSTEHRWRALTPFWLSADKWMCRPLVNNSIHLSPYWNCRKHGFAQDFQLADSLPQLHKTYH